MVHSHKNKQNDDNRYEFPDLGKPFTGWKDYDKDVLREINTVEDKVHYLEKRLELVFFGPMDNIFLENAPHHSVVNGHSMSFFFIGSVIICSCIETLGGYILGRFKESGEAGKRFCAFIDNYMKEWTATTPDGIEVKKWLWNNVRNALAHSFNINKGSLEKLGQERFKDDKDGKLLLHAELLYCDLKKAKDMYLNDVRNNIDGKITDNFVDCFDTVFIKQA